MRLNIVRSKNAVNLYIIESYINDKGKRSTRTVERLGNVEDLKKKLNGEDPYEWGRKRAKELTKKANEGKREVMVKFSNSKKIPMNENVKFQCGHLFLKKIYYDLKLDKFCNKITKNYKYSFDLNNILQILIYSRVLQPSSKKSSVEFSDSLVGNESLKLHDVYRALEVLSSKSEELQKTLYENSLSVVDRDSKVLFYDCTNYFFEIENEDGIKQYGYSKENKPNPIVQMGLFMDGSGIPLAFSLNSGNTNEQVTLKPLEKRIIKDFNLSNFVVCTDAGLASNANRKFNNISNRFFITTQSLKKLKNHLKIWALDPKGWRLLGHNKTYDISNIDEDKYKDLIFFKERWIKENDLEQRFIVTYSIKYRNYMRSIRQNHIDRAKKDIDKGKTNLERKRSNNYRRLIEKNHITPNGEIADSTIYSIDSKKINKESAYDGFYAICTNLEDDVEKIITINKRRWEIEECFRILKTEFKARPVYLRREDRIRAHFLICFISLLFYRIVEKKLDSQYSCQKIISTLRNMNFFKIKNEGYVPTYKRTDLTDHLHSVFGFRTDFEIITTKDIKNILVDLKKKETLRKKQ